MMEHKQQLFYILCCSVVLMLFYLGAVLLLNRFEPSDSPLAQEARSIIWAAQEYRASRGSYPVFPGQDSSVLDLKRELAKGGFLRQESGESSGPDKEARYVSNGNIFGLLFHIDRNEKNPSGQCLIEFGASETGWWGQPQRCQF
jgi:hypothetical protein